MKLHRDFLWMLAFRIAAALILLLSLRVCTSVLAPAEYGTLGMLYAFQSFCGLFLINPIGQYINRRTHAWLDEGSLFARLYHLRIYSVMVGLFGGLIACTWLANETYSLEIRVLYVIATAVMIISVTWNMTFVALLNMMGYRITSSVWSLITAASGLAFSYLFIQMQTSGLAWFAGQALGFFVGVIGGYLTLKRTTLLKRERNFPLISAAEIKSYCVPLAIAMGLMWLQISGYRLFFESHWGIAQLGYAFVGLGLMAQIWGLGESIVMQFFLPFYYRQISNATPDQAAIAFSDLLNTIGPAYLVLAAASIIATKSFFMLLIAPQYHEVFIFSWIGVFIECSRCITNIFINGLQINMNMRRLLKPYGYAAFIIVLLLIICIEANGSIFSAVAVVSMVSIFTAFAMYRSAKLENSFVLDAPRWLFGILLIAVALLSVMYLPLNPHNLVNSLAVVLIVSLALFLILFLMFRRSTNLIRLVKADLIKMDAS